MVAQWPDLSGQGAGALPLAPSVLQAAKTELGGSLWVTSDWERFPSFERALQRAVQNTPLAVFVTEYASLVDSVPSKDIPSLISEAVDKALEGRDDFDDRRRRRRGRRKSAVVLVVVRVKIQNDQKPKEETKKKKYEERNSPSVLTGRVGRGDDNECSFKTGGVENRIPSAESGWNARDTRDNLLGHRGKRTESVRLVGVRGTL